MPNIFNNEKFIVANLKQSGDLESSKKWISEFKNTISKIDLNVNVVICPSFPFLELFYRELVLDKTINKGRIFLGSQNISSNSNLENTGEVGAENIKNLVNFSITGHSERKENFDEVTKKYQNCINNKIIPIVCFYENKRVFELSNCIFAYEDPKAISKDGVFKEKTFDEMMEVVNELKDLFTDKTILYGGSVNKSNIQTIKDLEFFNGVLVGRVSLNPQEFAELIAIFNS
jgi:triosephosphate isomerase